MHHHLTNEVLRNRYELSAGIGEIVARTHDVVAASQALLARPMPTTFLGIRHYPPALAEVEGLAA